jgi:hypothetical protein
VKPALYACSHRLQRWWDAVDDKAPCVGGVPETGGPHYSSLSCGEEHPMQRTSCCRLGQQSWGEPRGERTLAVDACVCGGEIVDCLDTGNGDVHAGRMARQSGRVDKEGVSGQVLRVREGEPRDRPVVQQSLGRRVLSGHERPALRGFVTVDVLEYRWAGGEKSVGDPDRPVLREYTSVTDIHDGRRGRFRR